MSNNRTIVTGTFELIDPLLDAIRNLRASGHKDLSVYSPVPCDEIDEALESGGSGAISYIAFGAGVLGWISGIALTLGTVKVLPLLVGGKQMTSLIPFYVVCFELAILLTGLITVLALAKFAMPSRAMIKEKFNPRFAADRFGVAVRCTDDVQSGIKDILQANNVEEVSVEQIQN